MMKFPIAIILLLTLVNLNAQSQRNLSAALVRQNAEKYFENNRDGYKQYKRLEYHAMNRLGADGTIINSNKKTFDEFNRYMQASRAPGMRMAPSGNWNFVGPNVIASSNYGIGRTNRIAFHPTDPDIMWSSTAGGGLWKTEDQGLTWDPLTDGIPCMNTSGVAVNYDNTNIIYILTGDGDANGGSPGCCGFARASIGVLKTTDGGTLWKSTGLVFDEQSRVRAYDLNIDPANPNVLYVCSDSALLRSDDGAQTWDNIRNGVIYDMEFRPGTPDTIYCVDKEYVYISEDGGDTWSDSTLIPDVDGRTGRMAIAVCSSNSNLVYLIASPEDTISVTDSIPNHRGIFFSNNSAASFTKKSDSPNLLIGDGTLYGSQANYDLCIECNPLATDEIVIGTVWVWKSTNSGDSIDNIIANDYHADIHDLSVNPLDNKLYASTDGGIYMSEDFGDTWEFRSGFMAITQYYRMSGRESSVHDLLGGTQDNGSNMRDDIETEFDKVTGKDGMDCAFHPSVDSVMITGAQDGQFYLSMDGGESFDVVAPEPKGGDTAVWVTPVAFDPVDPNTIYLGYKPVFKSMDMGQSWAPTSNDTISGHIILEVSLDDPNTIYTGDCVNCDNSSIRFEMYVSTDAGSSWDAIHGNQDFPDTGVFISDLAIDPDNSEEIWISIGRYVADKKVYKSEDGGDTWTNMTGSLPNLPINTIIYDGSPGSANDAVYIGTDVGMFYRDNTLGDWVFFSNDLPRAEVSDLAIHEGEGVIRASTYGRGIWESDLYSACPPVLLLNASNQVIGHSYVHKVSNFIFSESIVDGFGANVVYKSENVIFLNKDFLATSKNGAFFKAVLGGCDDGGIEQIQEEPTAILRLPSSFDSHPPTSLILRLSSSDFPQDDKP